MVYLQYNTNLQRTCLHYTAHHTVSSHYTTLTITAATVTVQCVPSTTVAVVGADSVVTVVLTATVTSGALINICQKVSVHLILVYCTH